MGPPKKKPPRKSMLTKIHEVNTFEYRWNKTEGHYYLFNPYTGETVLGTNYDNINRNDSMWAKPDKFPSREAYTMTLYKESYKSRIWGVRRFSTPLDADRAVTVIASCVRGHRAREYVREIYRHRYYLKTCPFSGYDYFVDERTTSEDGSAVTSWHKPLLARPLDIKVRTAFDPDDHMADGHKYSMRSFEKGPYLAQGSLGKGNVTRVPQKAFRIESDFRDSAISRNDEIPLDAQLGTVIAWFEGIKAIPLTISHYLQARVAICTGDWDETLALFKRQPEHVLTRLYCFHAFQKVEVPFDGDSLSFSAAEVLNMIVAALDDRYHPSSQLEKMFMMRALHTLLSCRAGRAEFFSTKEIKEEGDERQKAIDAFNKARVTMLNRFLGYIPTEVLLTSVKGGKGFYKVRVPKPESVQLVELVLTLLGDIAVEPEHKELMSETIVEYVYYAMKVCQEEALVVTAGMKIFYALIFRCEPAQQMILCNDSLGMLKFVKLHHGGDAWTMRYCRKLELAMKHNGWRGYVEKIMAVEMRGEHIPRKYLKNAEYLREFSDKFKFPLELAEEERVAQEEAEHEKQAELDRLAEAELEFSREKALSRERSREATAGSRENTPGRLTRGKSALEATEEFARLFADGDDNVSHLGDGSILGSIGTGEDGSVERRKSVHFPDMAEAKGGGDDIMGRIKALEGQVKTEKGLLGLQAPEMTDSYLGSQYADPMSPMRDDFNDMGSVMDEGSMVSGVTDVDFEAQSPPKFGKRPASRGFKDQKEEK